MSRKGIMQGGVRMARHIYVEVDAEGTPMAIAYASEDDWYEEALVVKDGYGDSSTRVNDWWACDGPHGDAFRKATINEITRYVRALEDRAFNALCRIHKREQIK